MTDKIMGNASITAIPGDEVLRVARRTGRPTVLEQLGLTMEQLVTVYANSHTEREAAAKLQITPRTLRKYLYLSGVKPSQSPRMRRSGETYKPSVVYHWIREQHGIVPRSVRVIAERSGIREATVRRFLSRRRAVAMRYIEKLGSLREIEGKQLVTTRGQRFLTQQIAQSLPKVDLYDLSVTLVIMLRSGVSVKSVMSFNEYRRLFPEPVESDEPLRGFVTTLASPPESSPSS